MSRVRFPDGYFEGMRGAVTKATAAMDAIEAGACANAASGTRVGHYWLRAPELAPEPLAVAAIDAAVESVRSFAAAVKGGEVCGPGGPFRHVVHVGIGGSALGPQLVCDACAGDSDAPKVHFLDNADPDGIETLLADLEGQLDRTLVSVVSKSGVTPTPLHVLTELTAALARAGLDLTGQAVATTMADTELARRAADERWLACFPMWDWVGGRTSVTSAAGLLPAALAGIDVTALLDGAAVMDQATREPAAAENPAMLLALTWHCLGGGRGNKRMVVLPYKDRLALLPRYVQQLVMESVGKRSTRSGELAHQGLTVYGNKGSTDQHAYVQQLRDGTPDFFVNFVGVERDRQSSSVEIEPGVTLGDYLFASLEGTRDALFERGRDSITLTLPDVSPRSVGALIALYERAVGLYAELIDVNAYDQPGVDKFVAAAAVTLQREALDYLRGADAPASADEIAHRIARPEAVETIYRVLRRLARDPRREVTAIPGGGAFDERFERREPETA